MTAPQPLSFWVRTLDTLLQHQFAEAAEAAGLGRGQWQVLTRLRVGAVADGVLEESLAAFVRPDESAEAIVDRTIKDRLVEHQGNEYRLTERGLDRVGQVEDEAIGDLHGRAFEGVSQEERETLLSTLERVAANLGWQPA